MLTYSFLVETYDTERLKTLSVWSQFRDADLSFRPAPRAWTPLEHMVHQCLSEDGWMRLHPHSSTSAAPAHGCCCVESPIPATIEGS